MGLFLLILGLVVFVGGHLVTAARGLRAHLIGRLGQGGYRGLYSLVALVGLVLMVYGFGRYRAEGWIDIWYPPLALRHLSHLLILIALILIVAAYARGNIYRRLKHPMLAGIKLWALAHLLVNGDLGSIILFGGILAWAVIDRISLKRRSDAGGPPIPVGGVRNDVIAVAGGLALYLLIAFVLHRALIGVPVFGI